MELKGICMTGNRIAQLELLLLAHPEGLRRAEIARRIGVHRSTIGRYIEALEERVALTEENYIIKLAPRDGESQVNLNIHEALTLSIAAELLSAQTPYANVHTSTALRKIAENVRRHSSQLSDHINKIATSIEVAHNREGDEQLYEILDILTDGWHSGKLVKINHYAKGINDQKELQESVIAPYFIGFHDHNPKSPRKPITVTGRLRHTKTIETINIHDIESALILDEIFTIPDNLSPFAGSHPTLRQPGMDLIPLTLKLADRSSQNAFLTLYKEHESLIQDGDDWIWEVSMENSFDLFMKIFQCGTDIEILGPDFYRDFFKQKLSELTSLYL